MLARWTDPNHMLRFISYGSKSNNEKDVKSRRAHFWGPFWYYPYEQMTAFKVMEMIASSTKDYPHLHNQKFKAAALQNYHDGIFARIGTAAEQSIPVSSIFILFLQA